MDKSEKRPFSKISRFIFFLISIFTMLTVVLFVVFVLLRELIVFLGHLVFDKDYIGSLYKYIDDTLFNALTMIIGEHYPDTSKWGDTINVLTSNNIMELIINLLIVIAILIVVYSFTILMRHHYGEMAPFFNDMEARRVKRATVKKLNANLIKFRRRKEKVSKLEQLARKRIRRTTKVYIFTKIEQGQPKPVKNYHVRIKGHKNKDVKDKIKQKLKDFHFELSDITNDISFDDMKMPSNKRYFIFDGAKEVDLREARSVVKQREGSNNPKTIDNNSTGDDDLFEFPLSIFEDNSADIENGTKEAEKFAFSKVTKISTYFASINMSVEYLKCNVGKTSVEYVYSNRFGNSTKSESVLQQELGSELAEGSVTVNLEAKYIKVNMPLPEEKRVPIDTRESFKENLSNPKEPTDTIWGLTVDNKMFVKPVAESPHILSAGMTGSGKSVWLNSILIGMLAHATPDKLKIAIVDPKRNEFTDYKGLPHNIADPITDMADAETFLRYIEQVAEERYKIFEKTGKKNIYKYNKWAKKNGEEELPFIVTLVDEWNNLRKQSKECEKPLEGLGEKARAAGVHLIIATQRPSADVLTGTIKTNLPTKVAFSVDTAINSKIILEKDGAEKLNGLGDMYIRYKAADTLIRAQGLNIQDEEITAITDHLKEKNEKPNYVDYKAYMAKFDGEEVDEEENEQFMAATSLQETRNGFENNNVNSYEDTLNRRKKPEELSVKEKSTLERAKEKSEARKKNNKVLEEKPNNEKIHKKVTIDPMAYFNLDQNDNGASTTAKQPEEIKEDKPQKTTASTEDILGL